MFNASKRLTTGNGDPPPKTQNREPAPPVEPIEPVEPIDPTAPTKPAA